MNKAEALKRLIAAARDSALRTKDADLVDAIVDLDACDQAVPIANDHPPLWPLVIKHMEETYVGSIAPLVISDMQARSEYGVTHYGVPLQPLNGRDALKDLYEELLDARVYAEQAFTEGLVASNANPRYGWGSPTPTRDLERMILNVRGLMEDSAAEAVVQHVPQDSGKLIRPPAPTDLRSNVRAFHVAVGIKDPERPCVPSHDVVRLRARMLVEECVETLRAMFDPDDPGELQFLRKELDRVIDFSDVSVSLPDYADGLGDLMYIAEGGFLAFGIDSRPVHAAVQAANMAKVGGPVRADGKRGKPPGWTPPDIAGVIERQQKCDQ